MVRHTLAVEEGHLFLYGAKDAWVTSMQTNDEVATVVMFLHQGTLFLKRHVCAASNPGASLVTLGQRLRNQRASI